MCERLPHLLRVPAPLVDCCACGLGGLANQPIGHAGCPGCSISGPAGACMTFKFRISPGPILDHPRTGGDRNNLKSTINCNNTFAEIGRQLGGTKAHIDTKYRIPLLRYGLLARVARCASHLEHIIYLHGLLLVVIFAINLKGNKNKESRMSGCFCFVGRPRRNNTALLREIISDIPNTVFASNPSSSLPDSLHCPEWLPVNVSRYV
jgi:hypothetical protein